MDHIGVKTEESMRLLVKSEPTVGLPSNDVMEDFSKGKLHTV